MRIFIKVLLALFACILEFFAYVAIGVLLGWKHGGGVLPMTILFAIWGATFNFILRWGDSKATEISQPEKNITEDK